LSTYYRNTKAWNPTWTLRRMMGYWRLFLERKCQCKFILWVATRTENEQVPWSVILSVFEVTLAAKSFWFREDLRVWLEPALVFSEVSAYSRSSSEATG
jgi:hypothetical protein